MKQQTQTRKQSFTVRPYDNDDEIYIYEGNEQDARAKFEAEVEGTDDPPIEANFQVWCSNNLTLLKSTIKPTMKQTNTDTKDRKPMYENEMTRQSGLMATCNSCDRIIWEDENYREQYIESGGYCPECNANDNENPEPTTDKEVLHTSFKTLHIGLCSDDETIQLISEEGEHILQIESYPLKENAELIVKAVNERQKLLDSNRELLEAIQKYLYLNNNASYGIKNDIEEKLLTAINNAKNI